jgi:hypothetical protein
LHDAARLRDKGMVQILLKHGADPLSFNKAMETPVELGGREMGEIFDRFTVPWLSRRKFPGIALDCSVEAVGVCKEFYASLWFYARVTEMQPNGSEKDKVFSWMRKERVYDLIYKNKTLEKLENDFKQQVAQQVDLAAASGMRVFRWLHFPANNVSFLRLDQ